MFGGGGEGGAEQTKKGEGSDPTYEGGVNSAGKKHGEGAKDYPSGAIFQGQWANGKKHGKGVYTWSDGHQYDGDWDTGKKHGNGIEISADGSR
jgi:hypothetical protein